MEGKDKIWKIKPVRMPDELWYELMKIANKKKKATAQLIREILGEYLDKR